MTPRVSPTVLLLTGSLALVGCANIEGPRMGEGAGTVLGATAGGLVGGQIGQGTGNLAAVGAGVLLGALAGNQIGRSLDQGPRTALTTPTDRTLESLPSNRPTPWRNPDAAPAATGSAGPPLGTVAPIQGNAGNCREYQKTVTVGGEPRQGYGTACQQPDGSWRIIR
jgi:surface antigen